MAKVIKFEDYSGHGVLFERMSGNEPKLHDLTREQPIREQLMDIAEDMMIDGEDNMNADLLHYSGVLLEILEKFDG